ncbi:MAG: FtsX-like permease family protein [Anaerolineales bacterium]
MEKLFGLEMTTIATALGAVLALVLLVLAFLGWRNNVMLKLGLRPILRRRTQSSLIVVGLMLATLIITAAFVTGDTLSHTIRSLVIEEAGPVDELIRVRVDGDQNQSSYFSLSWYEDFAKQLEGYPLIDAAVPAIRENLPVVNLTQRQSTRSLSLIGLLPEDEELMPVEERTDPEGKLLPINALRGRELYLNQAAGEALDAHPGDELELYVRSSPRVFRVAGVSAAGRSPRAYMDLHQAQALFSESGRINNVLVSNLGDRIKGARYSEEVTAHLRALLSDDLASQRLFERLAADSSAALAIHSAAIGYDGNTRADLIALASGLSAGVLDDQVRSLLADETLGNEVQSILDQAEWGSESMRRRLQSQFSQLSDFTVDDTKRDGLDSADQGASAFTTIFIVTGLFGIASGLLLIFLIFVMLAAERKSEMGMARAIGAQRRHLIQMFVYEGTAYDLVAAGVGVLLGMFTGLVIALTLGRAFASTDLAIRPNVTLNSLAVSYSLGMLVTFLTVLISARRVSRLNIVAAIRDLPEQPPKPISLKERLLSPFRHFIAGFKNLWQLKIRMALRTWFISIPKSIIQIIWAAFRGGPLTFLVGAMFASAGVQGQSGALFTSGVSLALIGAGLMLRWVLGLIFPRRNVLTERIAFTLVGLSLTIFWSLPSNTFELIGINDLKSGPEMLFIAGSMMVIGAVMVMMYNTDLLLNLILRFLGNNRRLAPVLRMAVAYPLANRFRTGLTLGMFGVVVFSVVFMSTMFKANEVLFENTEAMTGGFELRASASPNNPIEDLARSAARQPELRNIGFEVITSETIFNVELQQEGGKWDWYGLRAVDEAYSDAVGYEFAVMAEGYDSADEIWQLISERPGYAIIDSYAVPSRQNTSIVIGGPEFKLEGPFLEDETMQPIRLRVRDPRGVTFEVTVIGVLEQAAGFNFALVTSQATLEKVLADPPVPTRYYIDLAEGVDPQSAGAALESAFLDYGLETVDQIEEIRDAQAAQRAIEQLLLGFLTLGLIVGVAALGVISSRAVVERRQQIGVLRAIGFQAEMVTWSFMIEASFVALLGISLGAGLAFIPAYQMINDIGTEIPGFTFQVPWGSIALVVGLAYGMALLATYLPAKQAAQVTPAEALRYE